MVTFISNILNYSTSMKIDGATRYISFINRGKPYNYGYFICYDDKLAEALKKHPDYGNMFHIKEEERKPVVEEVKYDAVYEDVKRTQEANKLLIERYQVDKESLKSKANALEAAKKLNISFPNLA